MIPPATHRTKVSEPGPRDLFPGWQMTCSCGAQSPIMSREGAELARDRHQFEVGLREWSA